MENVRNGNANLVDNTGTAIKNARNYSKQRTIKNNFLQNTVNRFPIPLQFSTTS